MKKKVLIIVISVIVTLAVAGTIVWACLASRKDGKKEDDGVCQHDVWTDTAMIVEPTCTTEGEKEQRCAKCDAQMRWARVDRLPHSEGVWIVDKESTMEEEGKRHTECTVCGLVINEELIPALQNTCEHVYGDKEWITVKEPTATENGIEKRFCNNCENAYEEREIPALEGTEAN